MAQMILTPDQLKADACKKEIARVLERYGMVMEPKFTATPQGFSLQVDLKFINQAQPPQPIGG